MRAGGGAGPTCRPASVTALFPSRSLLRRWLSTHTRKFWPHQSLGMPTVGRGLVPLICPARRAQAITHGQYGLAGDLYKRD